MRRCAQPTVLLSCSTVNGIQNDLGFNYFWWSNIVIISKTVGGGET